MHVYLFLFRSLRPWQAIPVSANDEYSRRESSLHVSTSGRWGVGDDGCNPEIDELKVCKISLCSTKHLQLWPWLIK